MNLLNETLDIMIQSGKTEEDVLFVNLPTELADRWCMNDVDFYSGTWDDFCELTKEFENYDSGFGGEEVPNIEIVFNDGSWLERGEYDGSEWWEYKQTPTRRLDEKRN